MAEDTAAVLGGLRRETPPPSLKEVVQPVLREVGRRAKGLARVVSGEASQTRAQELAEEVKYTAPFRMALEEIVGAFAERGQNLSAHPQTLEAATPMTGQKYTFRAIFGGIEISRKADTAGGQEVTTLTPKAKEVFAMRTTINGLRESITIDRLGHYVEVQEEKGRDGKIVEHRNSGRIDPDQFLRATSPSAYGKRLDNIVNTAVLGRQPTTTAK